MQDPLGIGTTRDVFQLEGKEQLVIDRLKSLTWGWDGSAMLNVARGDVFSVKVDAEILLS